MKHDFSRLTDTDLRSLSKNSNFVLRILAKGFSDRPDAQDAAQKLSGPEDILVTITELADKDPELMRLVLRASVTALVNVQSLKAVQSEMRRRAAPEN